MKKNCFLLIIICLCLEFFGNSVWAQNLEWAVGSPLNSGTENTTVDAAGNFYKVGAYTGVEDLDPGMGEYIIPLTHGEEEAAYIVKLNPAGEFVWAKVFEQGSSEANAVAVDAVGNAYIFGQYFENMDADPGPGEVLLPFNWDGKSFLIKLNAEGDFVWEKHFDGEHEEVYTAPLTLSVNMAGDVLLTGGFSNGLLDANPNEGEVFISSLTHSPSVFIIKLDTDGNFIWGDILAAVYDPDGPPDPPTISDVELDEDGAAYLCGKFTHLTDFGVGEEEVLRTPLSGTSNNYLLKLTAAGTTDWVKTFAPPAGSGGQFLFKGIAPDSDGSVYATGFFDTSTDFDPDAGETMLSGDEMKDGFLLKLAAADGSYAWANVMAGSGDDFGLDIAVNAEASKVFVTGSTNSATLPFGSFELATNGNHDIFVQSFLPDGTYDWGFVIGGDEADKGLFIGTDEANNLFLSGSYNGAVDFDFYDGTYWLDEVVSGGLYFAKFKDTCSAALLNETTITACGEYALPGTDTILYESSIYTDTVASPFSCDSVRTFDITIIPLPEPGSEIVSSCDPYITPSGTVYEATGVYTFVLTSEAGCDSLVTLDYTRLIDTVNTVVSACHAYTVPSGDETYNLSGIYTDTLVNHWGCDSIISIDLTVHDVDTMITVYDDSISVHQIGATYQWINCITGELLEGETEMTFVPAVSGTYAAIITTDDCSDTTTCVDFESSLGWTDQELIDLHLFPNPTNGTVTLQWQQALQQPVILQVYNPLGALILKKNVTDKMSFSFEVSGDSGTYVLQIQTETGAPHFYKIVKI